MTSAGVVPTRARAPREAHTIRPRDEPAFSSVRHRGRLLAACRGLAVALVLFFVALVPRLADLDAYVTIDESRWVQRAADFGALVDHRDDEDTFIIGHPGVTTMWTALLGMGPERARAFSFREGRTDVTRRDGYLDALLAARRPFAILAAAGVALITLLGWRLLGAGPALVGGLLLALEPFLVAHARVVHLDSMLATYTAVCLLAALVFWQGGGGWGYAILAGVAAGLAFLTKAPSVFVLGFVPLLALSQLLAGRRAGAPGARGLNVVAAGLVWGLVALVVCLALWPAFRVDPIGTLLKMAQFTERVGGGDHDNFFFGQVLEDPGPAFYPLALLFRLAPLTLAGLVFAAVGWRRLPAAQRRTVLTLGLYCLGFGLMMSLAPKKFDRYLLPVFPLLGLVAGLGLWTAWRSTMRFRPFGSGGASLALTATALVAVVSLQAGPLLAVHPHALAYYNPLLGGGATAQRVILVGWGEGLAEVADYLNAQPRALGLPTVATSYHRVLQAHLEGSALPLERARLADYVVPYVNTLQRGAEREALTPFLDAGRPELVVAINGIEYARVYRGPHHPLGASVGADFGGRATLVDYLTAPGSGVARVGEEIQMLLRWDRTAEGDERAAVQLLAPDGRVAVQDERPLGADGPDASGRLGEVHRLTVPPRTPPGEYRLVVRVSDPRQRGSLTVVNSTSGETEAVTLRTMTVEPGS